MTQSNDQKWDVGFIIAEGTSQPREGLVSFNQKLPIYYVLCETPLLESWRGF